MCEMCWELFRAFCSNFHAVSSSNKNPKIGQHLAKLQPEWTWHAFLAHSVVFLFLRFFVPTGRSVHLEQRRQSFRFDEVVRHHLVRRWGSVPGCRERRRPRRGTVLDQRRVSSVFLRLHPINPIVYRHGHSAGNWGTIIRASMKARRFEIGFIDRSVLFCSFSRSSRLFT